MERVACRGSQTALGSIGQCHNREQQSGAHPEDRQKQEHSDKKKKKKKSQTHIRTQYNKDHWRQIYYGRIQTKLTTSKKNILPPIRRKIWRQEVGEMQPNAIETPLTLNQLMRVQKDHNQNMGCGSWLDAIKATD